MDDLHGSKLTIVTRQLPTTKWHTFIGDATLADAILDRLLHNAHKLKRCSSCAGINVLNAS